MPAPNPLHDRLAAPLTDKTGPFPPLTNGKNSIGEAMGNQRSFLQRQR